MIRDNVFKASAKRSFSRAIDRRDVAARVVTMHEIRVIAWELENNRGLGVLRLRSDAAR